MRWKGYWNAGRWGRRGWLTSLREGGVAGPQIFLPCPFTDHQRLSSAKTREAEERLISEVALPCSCGEQRISVGKYRTLSWGLSECRLPAAGTKITAFWASEIAKQRKKHSIECKRQHLGDTGQLAKYPARLLSPLKSLSWRSLCREDEPGARWLSLFVSCHEHFHSRIPQVRWD